MYTAGPLDHFSSVDNWFQLSTLLLTIVSLTPLLKKTVRIAFGSYATLGAWISMSLFFQDLQMFNLGRYIVAFRKTIQNSIKFIPFFSMICLGFFFSLKIGEKMSALQPASSNEPEEGATKEKAQIESKTANYYSFIRIITMMVN